MPDSKPVHMRALRRVPERVSSDSQSSISDLSSYEEAYSYSIEKPDKFWLKATEKITWMNQPKIGLEGSFSSIIQTPIKWFSDGKLNVTESCLDSNLENRADKIAIIWESDEPGQSRHITYSELHSEVCLMSNVLKAHGAEKGDRIIIYMGMVEMEHQTTSKSYGIISARVAS